MPLSPHYDGDSVRVVLGIHLASLKIASEALGIPLPQLLIQGRRAFYAMPPNELQTLADQALQAARIPPDESD